jgi:dTDP-4-amino-4,6-dideoxy-D-galactose acyltransferase
MMRKLPWDSNLLGLSAAALNYLVATGSYEEQYAIKKLLLHALTELILSHGIRHVTARLETADLSGTHALENAGFITIDGILTFIRGTADVQATIPGGDIQLRLAGLEDSEATADLARVAYIYDRFHADPVISKQKANELHAAWLRNSCAGKAADSVVVGYRNKELVGFVTCKLQEDTRQHLGALLGTIVLVATSEAHRGRGIARRMTLYALEWFRKKEVAFVEVGTQLRNIAAARLYESCGFTLTSSSLSLRKVFEK